MHGGVMHGGAQRQRVAAAGEGCCWVRIRSTGSPKAWPLPLHDCIRWQARPHMSRRGVTRGSCCREAVLHFQTGKCAAGSGSCRLAGVTQGSARLLGSPDIGQAVSCFAARRAQPVASRTGSPKRCSATGSKAPARWPLLAAAGSWDRRATRCVASRLPYQSIM
jgi:hypothetical protein